MNDTTTSQSRIIRFGLFEVNLGAEELRKNGARIKLQQQPFQILVILLQHHGEIVTREQLREQLWPADTFVDFDHSLNAAVKRLRDALGESADNPIYIETLARRGYRFNAPLQLNPAHSANESNVAAAPVSPNPPINSKRPPVYPFVGTVLAIVLLLGIFLWVAHAHNSVSSKQRIQSLAVLPLENLSHDPDQEYFSDGMTGALTSTLAKIGPLRIISRTSTMRYKGSTKSLPEIARELHVDGIIEGSVLRSGNRVRINVELIDANSDKQLWAESYDRELFDILKLHSEVAQAVASQIRVRLAPEQQARLGSAPAVNQAAYEDYLKARFYLANGPSSYPAMKMAAALFETSIQKDPSFALAYDGLADCYLSLGEQRRLAPRDAYQHASELIHKALQIDDTLGETHNSLGFLLWQYEWNWQNAEREFRHALDLNPNYLDTHESLVWFLSWSGRRDDALAEIARMQELDPAFPLRLDNLAGLHYHLREYRELAETSQKAVDFSPGDWSRHYFLGSGYLGMGRNSDAISEFQKAVELSQNDIDTVAALAYAFTKVGKTPEARKILGDLQKQSRTIYISPYIVIWAGLGDKDKAFEFLEKSFSEKSTDLAYFVKADLRLDTLRSDSRFSALLRRMALVRASATMA